MKKVRKQGKIELKLSYYGSCEGYQEEWYCNHVRDLINSDPRCKRKVSFHLYNSNGGDPLEVAYSYRKSCSLVSESDLTRDGLLISIFDFDFKEKKFKEAITFCDSKKVKYYFSNVSFDLWLLLHFENFTKNICKENKNAYEKKLKKILNIKNDEDLKEEKNFNVLLKKISIDNIIEAIKKAKTIMKDPKSLTENPGLNIYILFEEILKKSGILD